MAELMLVNPAKRKTKTKRAKKKMATRRGMSRRSAAQKRATRRLVAMNRRRAASRRGGNRTSRARATASRVRRRTQRAIQRRAASVRRRAPRRATRYSRYRRNPASRKNMIQNIVDKQIRPAAVQASGAIALDVVYGYAGQFIPEQLNTGMIRHVTKGVVALGIGFVASNFMRNTTANEMAKGALTVTMHGAFKEALQQFMPAIPLGMDTAEMGYYNPSPVYQPTSQNMNPGGNMGYFEAGAGSGYAPHSLGYFSQDTGQGYQSMRRAENDLFDTADI